MSNAAAAGRRAACVLCIAWAVLLPACEFRSTRSQGGGAFEGPSGSDGRSDAYSAQYLTRNGATCFVVAGAGFSARRLDPSPPAYGSMMTDGGTYLRWTCEPERGRVSFETQRPAANGSTRGSRQTFDLGGGALFLVVERDGAVHIEQRFADMTKLAPTAITHAFRTLAVVDPRVAAFFDACGRRD